MISLCLEQAALEQGADAVVGIMSQMLDSLLQGGMTGYIKSDLYRYMKFREIWGTICGKDAGKPVGLLFG